MQKHTLKAILGVLLLIGSNLYAQKTITELSELSDKKFEKSVDIVNNAMSGMIVSTAKKARKKGYEVPENLKPELKKVGLITFFLVDESWVEFSKQGQGGWGLYSRKEDYLTPAGSETFVNQFYKSGLSSLQKSFADKGYEVLLPEEFLDTEEKKSTYESYEIELSKLAKIAKGLSNHLTKTYEKSPAVPEGFRLIQELTALDGLDKKAGQSAGELAKLLGLDAILTVKILVQLDKKELNLLAVEEYLHGSNPVPNGDYGPYGKYLLQKDGVIYAGAPLRLKKPIQFAEVHKKEGVSNIDIDGFDKVVQRLTDILLNRFDTSWTDN